MCGHGVLKNPSSRPASRRYKLIYLIYGRVPSDPRSAVPENCPASHAAGVCLTFNILSQIKETNEKVKRSSSTSKLVRQQVQRTTPASQVQVHDRTLGLRAASAFVSEATPMNLPAGQKGTCRAAGASLQPSIHHLYENSNICSSPLARIFVFPLRFVPIISKLVPQDTSGLDGLITHSPISRGVKRI